MGCLSAVLCILAGLLPAAGARGDTVVLDDGSAIVGQVRRGHESVVIRNADGMMTLPAWRVREIRIGAVVERMAQAPPPGPAPEPKAQPAAPAPPSVLRVLDERISVDFDGVPLNDVLDFIREVTRVNLVVDNAVRADQEPVYLRLTDVSVRSVLDVALGRRGYGYSVKPGNILFVGPGGLAGGYIVRIYPVTDLLLSREDAGLGAAASGGAGTAALGGGTGRTGGSGQGSGVFGVGGSGASPQFGLSGGGASVNATGANNARSYPMYQRAQGLGLLIQATCGQGAWQTGGPAVP